MCDPPGGYGWANRATSLSKLYGFADGNDMKIEYLNQFSKKKQVRLKQRFQRNKKVGFDRVIGCDQDFICQNCKAYVSGEVLLSGVHNRNHCPYCLHSRHMDLHEAGDRLAACKASMHPVGLTVKKSRNKYKEGGELMLIHLCSDCGKVSINRIAADDLKERILSVFIQTSELDQRTVNQLERDSIRILQSRDIELVQVRLYGKRDVVPDYV